MATYLIAKAENAGAQGLSRHKLMHLLYLTEREAIRHSGLAMADDQLILTPSGPVMKSVSNIMDNLEKGGPAWTRRIEHAPAGKAAATAVAEAAAPYNGQDTPANTVRLTLRTPHPQPRWEDHSQEFLEWYGQHEEGIPYLGELSLSDRRALDAAWDQHGRLDEDQLHRNALALPEVDGRTQGELAHSSILEALGRSPKYIQECLAFMAEMDSLDRINARLSATDDTEDLQDAENARARQ